MTVGLHTPVIKQVPSPQLGLCPALARVRGNAAPPPANAALTGDGEGSAAAAIGTAGAAVDAAAVVDAAAAVDAAAVVDAAAAAAVGAAAGVEAAVFCGAA